MKKLGLGSVLVVLVGCSATERPQIITLQEAMKGLGTAIEELRVIAETNEEEPKFGLVPAEISAVFQVAAKSENEIGIVLAKDSKDALDGSRKGIFNWSRSRSDSRSNTITVTLRNVLFVEKPSSPLLELLESIEGELESPLLDVGTAEAHEDKESEDE